MSSFWSSSLEPPSGTYSLWRPYTRWLAPVLLLVSVVVSAVQGIDPGTLGVAGLALVWLLLTHGLPPERFRENSWLRAISFAGALSAAAVLMARDLLFLVFMISCFFLALRLRPVPLAVLGTAATSLLINTLGSGGPVEALREHGFLFVTVVLVQTGAIIGGALGAARMAATVEARRQVVAALEAAQEENAGLHRQLFAQAREAGILDERQRLSREIHDTLAQGLMGIITQLEAAEDAPDRERRVRTALALARENLAEARRSVDALRPEALTRDRLDDALRGVAGRWAERTGVPVELTTTGDVRPLHPEVEATLLRITQEALANVAKHAGAGRVGVTLSYMEDQVTLDVRDDGKGFDPDSAHGGFGLPGMRQRAARLLGSFAVESEPGGGTAVSASLPAVVAAS
ncbi:sensor histidine kinase [Amycolatopsis sacchari]|uniref:Signal transduction histidine kinase n=1 Tax=Amycolatopsis sacchari TaxID=115433 RepID=A0A1I3Z9T4_9PSEU|nr:sensor histidine kinase [Amycolatopsis sacchari]SFK40339.1 Signal transduction histidine kinase [Amycolatopsis sacchari]